MKPKKARAFCQAQAQSPNFEKPGFCSSLAEILLRRIDLNCFQIFEFASSNHKNRTSDERGNKSFTFFSRGNDLLEQ